MASGISDKISNTMKGVTGEVKNQLKEIFDNKNPAIKVTAGVALIAISVLSLCAMAHVIDVSQTIDIGGKDISVMMITAFSTLIGGGFIYYIVNKEAQKREGQRTAAAAMWNTAKTVMKIMLVTAVGSLFMMTMISAGTFNFFDNPTWSSGMGLVLPVLAGGIGVARLLTFKKMNLTFAKIVMVQAFVSFLAVWGLTCANFAIADQAFGLTATIIGGGILALGFALNLEKVLRMKEAKKRHQVANGDARRV